MTDFSRFPELAVAQAVIFDCDGVLIDSWASTMYYFNHIRRAVDLGPMSPDQEAYCFIHTVEQSITHLVPEERLAEALAARPTVDMDRMIALIERKPGIRTFVTGLRKAGKKLAVCTNGASEQFEILKALDLLHRFDLVVTADDVDHGKPAPDGPRLILDHFELKPDQALFLGDSIMDQRAANAASIPFWAFENPDLDAVRHIRAYSELG